MISKKKVAQLCRKRKTLEVCTLKDGTQWVGAGSAYYVMDGLPKMKTTEYTAVFDFSQKDIDESVISEVDISNIIEAEFEIAVQSEPQTLIYCDEKFLCFSESNHFAIIPETQLAPVIMDENTAFYIRFGQAPIVCVKHGLFQEALIAATVFSETAIKAIESQCLTIINAVRNSTEKTYEETDNAQEELE